MTKLNYSSQIKVRGVCYFLQTGHRIPSIAVN